MKIETSKIRAGAMIGDTVWICHYHRPDLFKKPLRNVPPTRVKIRSIDELPKNKKVYYSQVYFSPLDAKGNPKSTVISPVDNTGYRSMCGNELHVFSNESECRQAYESEVKECVSRIDIMIDTAADQWRADKKALLNLL